MFDREEEFKKKVVIQSKDTSCLIFFYRKTPDLLRLNGQLLRERNRTVMTSAVTLFCTYLRVYPVTHQWTQVVNSTRASSFSDFYIAFQLLSMLCKNL